MLIGNLLINQILRRRSIREELTKGVVLYLGLVANQGVPGGFYDPGMGLAHYSPRYIVDRIVDFCM